jgi:hypothetical protein
VAPAGVADARRMMTGKKPVFVKKAVCRGRG